MTQTAQPVAHTLRAQIRNGGKSAVVGTAFGLMWYVFGLSGSKGTGHQVALAAGLALLALTLLAMADVFRLVGRVPEDAPGRPVIPGSGPNFATIVVIEALILAVGNNYLRSNLHRPELMYTWSAIVVGAHFFPMARKLRAPMLRVVGGGMLAVAALTAALAVARDHGPDLLSSTLWQTVPGLGCAAILWSSVLLTSLRARRLARG